MISVLFTQEDSGYLQEPDVDCWPESRNALLYTGTNPVIAHPPCARWCRLAKAVQGRYPHLRVGEDGGMFAFALETVRRCGGVLEHPAHTLAWRTYGLPVPDPKGGWRAGGYIGGSLRSWVCTVAQSAYGHRARKLTWLYYVGTSRPPELHWEQPRGTSWVSFCAAPTNVIDRPRLGKKEASATPPAFRKELIRLANWSRNPSESA